MKLCKDDFISSHKSNRVNMCIKPSLSSDIAMAGAHLPEDIIVNILSRLPVRSLIRFSCVSKRLYFIIFSDPKFARSQFKAACEHKTLGRRLLLSTKVPQLESLDLETPSFGETSSVRKLNNPLQQPGFVRLLGSCNGLVFVAFRERLFYIWNPAIGFLKQLPDPGFSSISNDRELNFYGVGYLSATDNYKVFLGSYEFIEEKEEVEMFSLRSHIWKRIQVPSDSSPSWLCQGTLLNEALHWVEEGDDGILVFDLALEEFSQMRLPIFHPPGDFSINLGVSFGGCLCVCRRPRPAFDCIDFWVMRQYDVRGDSWTKHFNLQLPNLPEEIRYYSDILVMETSIVAKSYHGSLLVRIDLKEEDKLEMYETNARWFNMISYEESLLRI